MARRPAAAAGAGLRALLSPFVTIDAVSLAIECRSGS
jgi:hypothetical protein